MTDERSGRLSLPYMHAGQAQKEVAHNEALALLDIIVAAGVESADLSAPPASPTDGQCWIVAGPGTGAWGGQGGRMDTGRLAFRRAAAGNAHLGRGSGVCHDPDSDRLGRRRGPAGRYLYRR